MKRLLCTILYICIDNFLLPNDLKHLDLDWLQSLKQFFIDVSYHILVASLTLMALKTEPSELDWL